MEITTGIMKSPQKVVIYGVEGIGKSTLASHFPSPVFIDTEGSTKRLNVARLPKPLGWQHLLEEVAYIIGSEGENGKYKTLVIDTIDWAERMCVDHVCVSHKKKGIEDFGYGNGYIYTMEEMGQFLNLLNDVIQKANMHVVLIAHAQIRKIELPDEMGAYDKYELKLGKKTSSQTSPLVKEWADMVLFANYKTHVIVTDEKNNRGKAQGNRRILFTTHHPCWDAKNRHDLPEEIEMDYKNIAHCMDDFTVPAAAPVVAETPPVEVISEHVPVPETPPEPQVPEQDPDKVIPENASPELLKAMQELDAIAKEAGVTKAEIQKVVTERGYFPAGTPIPNYGVEFIRGVLIGAWPQVVQMIAAEKDCQEVFGTENGGNE